MSGGSFDYAWLRVGEFLLNLEERLERPEIEEDFKPETIAKLREIAETIHLASKLMREVGKLYSGDTGNETFLERVVEIEKEWIAQ
jgi:hypothetical protein